MAIKEKSETVKHIEKIMGRASTFGSMIHSLRLCDEISQANLAKKLKISRAHLCDIEKGRRFVSAKRAAQFAEVMGYSATQFVSLALEDQIREAGLKLKVYVEAA